MTEVVFRGFTTLPTALLLECLSFLPRLISSLVQQVCRAWQTNLSSPTSKRTIAQFPLSRIRIKYQWARPTLNTFLWNGSHIITSDDDGLLTYHPDSGETTPLIKLNSVRGYRVSLLNVILCYSQPDFHLFDSVSGNLLHKWTYTLVRYDSFQLIEDKVYIENSRKGSILQYSLSGELLHSWTFSKYDRVSFSRDYFLLHPKKKDGPSRIYSTHPTEGAEETMQIATFIPSDGAELDYIFPLNEVIICHKSFAKKLEGWDWKTQKLLFEWEIPYEDATFHPCGDELELTGDDTYCILVCV